MNAGKTSFWSRVGGLFRAPGRLSVPEQDGRENEGPPAGVITSPDVPPVEDGLPAASRRGLARREPGGRERLEEGFAKVVELVTSLQEHFKLQDERGERMARSLDRVAESLAAVPGASQNQLESLARIHEQLQAEIATAKRLEELLSELPHIADAQRESMVSIGRQLDVMRDRGDNSTAALSELHQTVSRLGEAAGASTAVLKSFHVESAAREERTAELLERQTRRLTFFAWSVTVLAALAVVVSVVVLLR